MASLSNSYLLVSKLYENSNSDYTSNCYPRSFPDGLDVEVFSFKALKKAFLNAKTTYDKEHVTTYIKKDKNLIKNFLSSKNQELS